MKESQSIKEIVNQTAMQAVTAVMMVLRDADEGLWLATTASPGKP